MPPTETATTAEPVLSCGDGVEPRPPKPSIDALDTVERALTQVGRAILRMGVPPEALAEGEHVDRSGYWTLVRLDEAGGPMRLSDLAAALELDLSTVSRQARQLVDTGLLERHSDPDDGRATLVTLSARGRAVLEAVRNARRDVLRRTLCAWAPEERTTLAAALDRLAADMQRGEGK